MARKKLKPKDKRASKWWQKRNEARSELQKAHARAKEVAPKMVIEEFVEMKELLES